MAGFGFALSLSLSLFGELEMRKYTYLENKTQTKLWLYKLFGL